MSDDLVISTTNTVHTIECVHVRFYVDGKFRREIQANEYEDHPTDPDFSRQVAVDRVDSDNRRITVDELLVFDELYRGCRACSPMIPPCRASRTSTTKAAGALSNADVGRVTTNGRIVAVELHGSHVIVMLDDSAITLSPLDRLAFPILRKAVA